MFSGPTISSSTSIRWVATIDTSEVDAISHSASAITSRNFSFKDLSFVFSNLIKLEIKKDIN